ncbi:MAG: hypothetical protein OXF74_09340 [Rhodobacteraceae bacterium]|nr:hypothetical protein [Paracoccaceae bacterium]
MVRHLPCRYGGYCELRNSDENMCETALKWEDLRQLARLRQRTRLAGYRCLKDFHDGAFECDYVSPFTKSGNNVNAEIMIVGQDWAGADYLANDPQAFDDAARGYDPNSLTNRKLDSLLEDHFGVSREECCLTNLFPFIKPGGMSARIRLGDLICCARMFTLPEIRIVCPRLVICLGLETFRAVGSAACPGRVRRIRLKEGIDSPFCLDGISVHCVAHPAVRPGNRSSAQIKEDWSNLANLLASKLGPASD